MRDFHAIETRGDFDSDAVGKEQIAFLQVAPVLGITARQIDAVRIDEIHRRALTRAGPVDNMRGSLFGCRAGEVEAEQADRAKGFGDAGRGGAEGNGIGGSAKCGGGEMLHWGAP